MHPEEGEKEDTKKRIEKTSLLKERKEYNWSTL